jgi:hypothetical protein
MIRSMAKARSSKKGKSEGPDLFAFAAVRSTEVGLSEPAPAQSAEPTEVAAVDDPAAVAGELVAGLDRLQDGDLLDLLAALGAEAERRGSKPVRAADSAIPKPVARLKPSPVQMARPGPSSIPTSKVNAIRAALEAGFKPGAVARQFGVSIAQIKKLFEEG